MLKGNDIQWGNLVLSEDGGYELTIFGKNEKVDGIKNIEYQTANRYWLDTTKELKSILEFIDFKKVDVYDIFDGVEEYKGRVLDSKFEEFINLLDSGDYNGMEVFLDTI